MNTNFQLDTMNPWNSIDRGRISVLVLYASLFFQIKKKKEIPQTYLE